MNVHISVHYQNEIKELLCEESGFVSSVLREAGLLALPCGIGKCGKCIIYANTIPTKEEIELLGENRITEGFRLACYTKASEGLEIRIPTKEDLKVLTYYSSVDYEYKPLVKRIPVVIEEPTLEDQRCDLQRLLDASKLKKSFLSTKRLCQLPKEIRSNSINYAVVQDDCLIGFGKNKESYGLIVDIGTTTVATMLINTTTEKFIASLGEQNVQASFGADVISRISREMEWEQSGSIGENPLQSAIVNQIDKMLHQLLKENKIIDVDFISITGNTTMMHFLQGIPCEHISKAPFIPVVLQAQRVHANELGINSQAICYLMPSISSYIGADIVGSLLAADAHHKQDPFILIDLGTNAEIVLYNNGKLLSCSAAAGPCFEGATLSCGMAGQNGAIDSVQYNNENGLEFSTIGNVEASGICGSGVLDAIALLLDKELVDETGKLESDNTVLGKKVHDDALFFTDNVYITQQDIREVQLAKSAVRAGVEILLREANLTLNDIHCLYLAGGFGSALKPESAARIGLIPIELVTKVKVLGNGASFGALRYVTEDEAYKNAEELINKMHYIELSSHVGFTNAYIEFMIFPIL